MKTVKIGTIIPRSVGETFYATPVTGGVAILVKVVKVVTTATGFILFCKLLGL